MKVLRFCSLIAVSAISMLGWSCSQVPQTVKCTPPKTVFACAAIAWPPGTPPELIDSKLVDCKVLQNTYACGLDQQEALDQMVKTVNDWIASSKLAGWKIRYDCFDTGTSQYTPNPMPNSEKPLFKTEAVPDPNSCDEASYSQEIDVPSCTPDPTDTSCLNCARKKCCSDVMACVGAATMAGDKICSCIVQCEAGGGTQQICENGDPTIPGSGCGLDPITIQTEACMNVNCPVECAMPSAPVPPHPESRILGGLFPKKK